LPQSQLLPRSCRVACNSIWSSSFSGEMHMRSVLRSIQRRLNDEIELSIVELDS
jgi:hypothetical protein